LAAAGFKHKRRKMHTDGQQAEFDNAPTILEVNDPALGADPKPHLFELDYEHADVELIVGEKKKIALVHRLQRPTFEQLHNRFQKVINQEVSQANNEVEPIYSDTAANVYLYDQTVLAVRNYRTGQEDASGWTRDRELVRSLMTTAHKANAISALYQTEARMIEDEAGDGLFPLVGASEVCIELDIAGQFKTRHYLQAPSEAQWAALQSKRVQTRASRDNKKQVYSYRVNLAPARDFYDQLLTRIEGVKLRSGAEYSSADRSLFVNAVDAIHKQIVINRFCDYWGGRLRD